MNRREAKREACFKVWLWIRSVVDGGYEFEDPRIEGGVEEIAREMWRRSGAPGEVDEQVAAGVVVEARRISSGNNRDAPRDDDSVAEVP